MKSLACLTTAHSLLMMVLLALPIMSGAVTTITVGDAERPWEEGGGTDNTDPRGITPDAQVSRTEAQRGNTPGGVMKFQYEGRPGWIVPTPVDSGRNLFAQILERGGNLSVSVPVNNLENLTSDELVEVLLSGTPEKALDVKGVNALGTLVTVDLYARFGVDRIRFYPRNTVQSAPEYPFQNAFPNAFELLINDGTPENMTEAGYPLWTRIYYTEANPDTVVEVRLPLQYVRFIRFRSRTTAGFEIDEIEAYGKGYVPVATYVSDVLDMGAPTVWGTIRWKDEAIGDPTRSALFVSTRSGNDTTPLVFNRIVVSVEGEPYALEAHRTEYEELEEYLRGPVETPTRTYTARAYQQLSEAMKDTLEAQGARYIRRPRLYEAVSFDRNGDPLILDTYTGLPERERGFVEDDTEQWSPWSAPYSAVDMPISSPSPRRYFQFRIILQSDALDAARAVDDLSFDISPPVADKLIAEIFPREAQPLMPTLFTYAVRATIQRERDPGFDSFRVETPDRVQGIHSAAVYNAEGTLLSEATFDEDLGTATLPIHSGDMTISEVTEDHFVVHFPRITQDQTLLKILFTSRVFRYGTTFKGTASIRGASEIPQQVVPGDAAYLGEGDMEGESGLSVCTSFGSALLGGVRVIPNPFTPNGDGVNDRCEIQYSLLGVTEDTRVDVDVLNLQGDRVRRLYKETVPSGAYSVYWDGTDRDRDLLPPGVYLYRIHVHADVESEARTGTITLIY